MNHLGGGTDCDDTDPTKSAPEDCPPEVTGEDEEIPEEEAEAEGAAGRKTGIDLGFHWMLDEPQPNSTPVA